MATPSPAPAAPASIPRDVHEILVDLAVAIHKRTFYPASHPILQGSIGSVSNRMEAFLADEPELSLGVSERRLIINGVPAAEDQSMYAELASRLSDHLIGAIRIVPGVSRDEMERFVEGVAAPPTENPLGTQAALTFQHIALFPVAFNRLGLLADGGGRRDRRRDDALWRALASAALRQDSVGGEVLDPAGLGEAIRNGAGNSEGDRILLERLAEMLTDACASGESLSPGQRERLSALVVGIGEESVARLIASADDRGRGFVKAGTSSLGTQAVVELLKAAARTGAVSVSGAMLRLLQKLAGQAEQGGARGADADRVLRASMRRLLEDWTLENPNPLMYERVLTDASGPGGPPRPDRHRDTVEPERTLGLSLETQTLGQHAESALARFAMRHGMAETFEWLNAYPASEIREALIDRLLNESAFREYLRQPLLDAPLLRHAVDRLKARAIEPLVTGLIERSAADSPLLAELLARIGWDVLQPLGAHLITATPSLLRNLLVVFDKLDAWPPQADPARYADHPDVVVRREAIKYLLRSEATREQGMMAALRDQEVRLFTLGVNAVVRPCPPAAARLIMARYLDAGLTPELRGRAIRAVGNCETAEVLEWLRSLALARRWLFGSTRLRKATPEVTAAAVAIVTHFRAGPVAQRIVSLSTSGRHPDIRRALARVRERPES